jgi:hypothetical protein
MPDSIVEKLRVPTNLFDELINLGWQRIIDNGRPVMVPEPRLMNDWILILNALPN